MKVYVSYEVPTGYENQVNATAPLVTYPGDPAVTPPTAYGGNTLLDDTSTAYGDLIGTLATIPGSNYHTKPYRQWTYAADWIGWLNGLGFQPEQAA